MNDGLDEPELLDFVVSELQGEFPHWERDHVAAAVHERIRFMSRPASGGQLFLEARKVMHLMDDFSEHSPQSWHARPTSHEGLEMRA